MNGSKARRTDRAGFAREREEVMDRSEIQAVVRDRAPKAPTQSPAVIAGLRRIATSLWLHFVASPQRMPITRYRRSGRPVVDLIYRVPPSSIPTTSAIPRGNELEEHPVHGSSCETGCGPRCPTYESRPFISSLRRPEKSCKRISVDAAAMIIAGFAVGLFDTIVGAIEQRTSHARCDARRSTGPAIGRTRKPL